MIKNTIIIAVLVFSESIFASQNSIVPNKSSMEEEMRNDMIQTHEQAIDCLKKIDSLPKQCENQFNHKMQEIHNKYLLNIHRGIIHKTTM